MKKVVALYWRITELLDNYLGIPTVAALIFVLISACLCMYTDVDTEKLVLANVVVVAIVAILFVAWIVTQMIERIMFEKNEKNITEEDYYGR